MTFSKELVPAHIHCGLISKFDTPTGSMSFHQTCTSDGQINWFLIRVIALVCIPDKIPQFQRSPQDHMLFLCTGRPLFIINVQLLVESCLLF